MEEQVAIFCDVDDFYRDYEEYCTHSLLMDKNKIVPETRVALSEIITIYQDIEHSNDITSIR